ncbi:MAG: hypothetical protein J3Q66DRAFT_153640 [Benniella sp.]|nr:MAG: hypothetical protein J3Q66DRAFT_153640 [Benniella sp.]
MLFVRHSGWRSHQLKKTDMKPFSRRLFDLLCPQCRIHNVLATYCSKKTVVVSWVIVNGKRERDATDPLCERVGQWPSTNDPREGGRSHFSLPSSRPHFPLPNTTHQPRQPSAQQGDFQLEGDSRGKQPEQPSGTTMTGNKESSCAESTKPESVQEQLTQKMPRVGTLLLLAEYACCSGASTQRMRSTPLYHYPVFDKDKEVLCSSCAGVVHIDALRGRMCQGHCAGPTILAPRANKDTRILGRRHNG